MTYINFRKKAVAANIDLTYKCNLGCSQCMRHVLEEDTSAKEKFKNKLSASSDLPLQDLDKILDFFDSVGFCGGLSDPIFYPYIDQLLEKCSTFKNKAYTIHTAATQKNIEWYNKIFDITPENVTWVFGLDGLADTSYIYRKRQNSLLLFDAMILAAKKNVKVEWQYIVFPYNRIQIDKAKEIAKENNINLTLVYSNRDEKGNIIPGLETRRERFKFRINRK